jgi:hypothetical protein
MSSQEYDPMALLATPVSDVKPPTRMPVGSYAALANKFEFAKVKAKDSGKETTKVTFTVVPTEAGPDVNAEALAEALDGEALTEKSLKLDFWITKDALYRLVEFGKDHVKVPKAEQLSNQELIEQIASGQFPFMINLVEAPNAKEPNRPYINIGSTAAMPG